MKKTKIGLPNGVFAALIFIAAYVSPICLLMTLAFVCFFEEDEFVKASVKRATVLYVFFKLIYLVLSVINSLVHTIWYSPASWYSKTYSKIDYVVDIIYIILTLLMAFNALVSQEVKKTVFDIDAADNILMSTTQAVQGAANKVSEKINNGKTEAPKKVCPNCGKEIPADSAFCTSCGTKVE